MGPLDSDGQANKASSPTESQADASPSSPARKRCKTTPKLPLPGTSRRQALLLLHSLYAWDRKSWAEGLDLPELADLARVAHKFASCVLQLADSSLVEVCQTEDAHAQDPDSWLNTTTAPELLQLAADLSLVKFERHVAFFCGMQAAIVTPNIFDARTAAVLRGAECRRRMSFPEQDEHNTSSQA